MPLPAIQHVFVLMLENRSFDHLLGRSGISGTDAETGAPTRLNGLTGHETSPYGGRDYGVSPAAVGPLDADPGHEFPHVVEQLCGAGATFPQGGPYPPRTGTGFAASFMATAGTAAGADPGEIMRSFPPEKLPVVNALAREFAVCDAWFSSLPGPTLPNRFFLLAGSSGGLDHSPSNLEMLEELTVDGVPFEHGTIFQQPIRTRIYCGGPLHMAQTMKGVTFEDVHHYSKFADDVNSPATPYDVAFTLIEPDYGDVTGTFKGGTSQHPMDSVTGGERLIKEVYETLRNSPLWEQSLLVVVWDEHGGFYDHVLPPPAVPPGDTAVWKKANQYGFDFSLYGARVPAVVISPLVPRNLVDHRVYDHTSVLATTHALFNLPPLTKRDAAARTLLSLASLPAPRATPTHLPDPAPADHTEAAPVDKSKSADTGNVPAFLMVARKLAAHLSPPALHGEILDQARKVETLTHAGDFLRGIEAKIATALTQKGRTKG